jgi:putative endonuclease
VHFVYIVRCADGTLYTGYARNPLARERAHNSGRGAKYTVGRRPVQLVYQEAFRSVRKALAREYVVKQLTRAQKEALVASGKRRRRLRLGREVVASEEVDPNASAPPLHDSSAHPPHPTRCLR